MTGLIYDDQYPTCNATYATLCIYGDDLDPNAVTSLFGIEPSQTQRKGEQLKKGVVRRKGWFLSTENTVVSRDVRRHVHWLIETFSSKEEAFHQLRSQSYETVVSCYWMSASGHGGPMLSPKLMRSLSDLGVEIRFDIYFCRE
jgi:hypothetical protein